MGNGPRTKMAGEMAGGHFFRGGGGVPQWPKSGRANSWTTKAVEFLPPQKSCRWPFADHFSAILVLGQVPILQQAKQVANLGAFAGCFRGIFVDVGAPPPMEQIRKPTALKNAEENCFLSQVPSPQPDSHVREQGPLSSCTEASPEAIGDEIFDFWEPVQ